MGLYYIYSILSGNLLTKLPDGMKPIEEIRKGDWVWSVAPETGDPELKQVEDVFVNETDEIVHVRYGDTEIDATPNHPFYVAEKGWVSAVNLRAGDRLQLVNGEYVTVEQVQHEMLGSPVKVYNFRVADNHTYYVGNDGEAVLVHNAKCFVEENGVKISSNYPNDHGSPAHVHVSEKGASTKIDPQGKPVNGFPQLSSQQAKVVQKYLSQIKNAQKYLRKTKNG